MPACLLFLTSVLFATPRQVGMPAVSYGSQIGAVARQESEAFYRGNVSGNVTEIELRGLAAYIEASRAYKARDYKHCEAVLDELWRDYPISSTKWWGANDQTHTVNPGFSGYPAMLMLDEAVRWRNNPASATVKPRPILLEVLLFGRSTGIQPRNMAELLAGKGAPAVARLDQRLLADDYKLLRNCVWLFREYMWAATKGRLSVDLDFTYLPERTVQVDCQVVKNPTVPPTHSVLLRQRETEFDVQLQDIASELKVKPDWWWSIVPSLVPDQYPDFKNQEFITGGMAHGADMRSPNFLIDDEWMVRRPGHLGRGAYASIEIEAYMPQWLQHEINHFFFATYPEFELEKTGHMWHKLEAWPKDFVGLFEPDYYREALHKRLQTKANPPLDIKLRFAAPKPSDLAKIGAREIVGRYRHLPIDNPWLVGDISIAEPGADGRTLLKWTNGANVSWLLDPQVETGGLRTGPDCPYFKEPRPDSKQFSIVLERDSNGDYTSHVAGFYFLGAYYAKDR